MPELPDITVYLEALESRIVGARLRAVRLTSPFFLRTAVPPLADVHGRDVLALRRIGKRIAIGFDGELWLVIHLMIAGRLHWKETAATLPRKRGLAAFDFDRGTLLVTEAGTTKRASLHVAVGEAGLAALDPGGREIAATTLDEFSETLTRRNHTLKRALTDPRLFSGIGNAYSDEILHRAQLSPVLLTQRLSAQQIATLFAAIRTVLGEWTAKLRERAGAEFPERVTAFRDGMAVHGRYGEPCPVCATQVQRIRYASNETNYCPRCQTGGKLLADRSLSRLLKRDWPKTVDELERGGR